jgi:hypothetical protein
LNNCRITVSTSRPMENKNVYRAVQMAERVWSAHEPMNKDTGRR